MKTLRWTLFTLVVAIALVSVSPVRAGTSPPDNSGKNVRDRSANAVTADSQSNSESDLRITQAIRQAVVQDKDLSTSAHNVKIITNEGVVTLRGPVTSQQEKATIEAKATHVAGVTRVDNRLEIAKR